MICILGPTASGKTRLGVTLAQHFHGEIISADSRQVYRGMDIGTGKDLDEYGDTPYHLIDIAEPDEEYNLFRFVQDYNTSLNRVPSECLPLLVGGTGMYLDAVLNRYQLTRAQQNPKQYRDLSDEALRDRLLILKPDQHNTTDLADRKRLEAALHIAEAEARGDEQLCAVATRNLVFGIRMERSENRKRITQRLKQRLESGMVEEVEHLHRKGISWNQLDFFGLEYRYIALYLQGNLAYNDMYQKLNSAIHQFAKQQEKWFRNIEKKGTAIVWLDASSDIEAQAISGAHHFLDTHSRSL